jgi:replicative DNA helicase
VDTPCISTGFTKLDEALDGGLYEGLYIMGAISSLGKTTLIIQIADQIAQAGQDVLIFSLEMARTEIMAKSISRHTLQQVLSNGGDVRNAKTTRGITTGKRYLKYSKAEHEIINGALTAYGTYADRIYISEGIGDIGAEQIRETVKQHILFTGNTPVVIVDYLQILAPYNERATDKQNTDKAVLELKRISRDYKTPVIGISSFNRANYSVAVTMEAYKESGAIEYSGDVLLGLQLKGVGEKSFDANEAKKKNPREVELVVLKNRNGRTGDKLEYKYYPLFNYFKEE